ncbi:MAG: hypothetical protein OEM79_03515 [Nitrosopumilus sp.]|nr:hypothetical protein [Nitrosopumilus sp.]
MKRNKKSPLLDDPLIKEHIRKCFQQTFEKEPNKEIINLYFQKIKNGAILLEDLSEVLKKSSESNPSIKQITKNFSLPIEEIFTLIYQNKLWSKSSSTGTGISRSGSGANLEQTKSIRTELPKLLRELKINSMIDVPCGDFLWMKEINLDFLSYLGCDIVSEIIEKNNKTYSNEKRKFFKLNITQDSLPETD